MTENIENNVFKDCKNKLLEVKEDIKRNLQLLYPLLIKCKSPINTNYLIKNWAGKTIDVYSCARFYIGKKKKEIDIYSSDNIRPYRDGNYMTFEIELLKKNKNKIFKRNTRIYSGSIPEIKIGAAHPINIGNGTNRPINDFFKGCLDWFDERPQETAFLLKNISKTLIVLLDSTKPGKGCYQDSLNSLNEVSKLNSEAFEKEILNPEMYENPSEFKETFLNLKEEHQKQISNYIYNSKNNDNKEIRGWLLENFPALIRK